MPCGTWLLECLHPSLLSGQEVGIASLKLCILILRLSSRTLVLTESPLSYHLSPGCLSRLISKTTFITAHSGSEMRLSDTVAAALVCGGFSGNSAGKESAYKAGDPGSIPRSRRCPGEGIGSPLQYSWASLVAQTVKKSACNEGYLGGIPGLGRSPGGGHGNPLHYSFLESPHG